MTAPPPACRLTPGRSRQSFCRTSFERGHDNMTIRRLLALTSATALLGIGACSDNTRPRGTDNTATGSTSTTGSTNDNSSATGSTSTTGAPEGRAGPALPRARPDGGTSLSPGAPGSVSGTPDNTTSGTSSGSNADQTAPATGTTPGDTGQKPSNGSDTSSTPSTNPGK